LETENLRLRAENKELRRRLGLTSENSHKPPGSAGYRKQSVRPALPKEGTKSVEDKKVIKEKRCFGFCFRRGLPFTNNLAERDLRPAKPNQK